MPWETQQTKVAHSGIGVRPEETVSSSHGRSKAGSHFQDRNTSLLFFTRELKRRGNGPQTDGIRINGFTVNRNINEDRESPGYKVIELLVQYGELIECNDLYIQPIGGNREYRPFLDTKRFSTDHPDQCAATVLFADHSDFDDLSRVHPSNSVTGSRNTCTQINSNKFFEV